MSEHPLLHVLHRLRRRARRLQCTMGAARYVTVVLATFIFCAIADYVFRWEDAGGRLLGTSLFALVAAGSLWWFLARPLRGRMTDLGLARQVERTFPQLRDHLTSAVAFAQTGAGDVSLGSPQLRRRVVRDVERQVSALPLDQCLNRSALHRRLLWMGLVVIAAAGLGITDWGAARVAGKRLFQPLANHPWPRRHQLEWIEAPQVLAVGQALEVSLRDRGRLPDQVEFLYRSPGETAAQVAEMRPAGDRMVFRLDRVTRPLEYRARGGDDDTLPWRTLRLVEPPRLVDLRTTVTPPDYTRRPAVEVSGQIRALTGSHVDVQGRADQPLESAVLVTDTMGEVQRWTARLSADRQTFHVPSAEIWELVRSGYYALELTGRDGAVNVTPPRWNVQVFPDAPPTVELVRPETNLTVAVDAVVAFEGEVDDDLGLTQLWLEYRRSDLAVDAAPVALARWDRQNTPSVPTQQRLEFSWDLGMVPELGPGTVLEASVVAVDSLGQRGTSAPLRLRIVSPDQLSDRYELMRSRILARLQEAQAAQQYARTEVREASHTVSGGDESGSAADSLLQAVTAQRSVNRILFDSEESVWAETQQLRALLQTNQSRRPDAVETLDAFQRGLAEIREDHAAAALDTLAQLRRGAERGRPASEWQSLLTEAGAEQDAMVEALDRLAGLLSQWDQFQRFAVELQRLQREQQEIRDDTVGLRDARLAGDEASTEGTPTSTLLALAQGDAARRWERLLEAMIEFQDRTEDAAVRSTLARVIQSARRNELSREFEDARTALAEDRVGAAASNHARIHRALQELRDLLEPRGTTPPRSPAAVVARSLSRLQEEVRLRQAELETTADRDLPLWSESTERLAERVGALEQALRDGSDESAANLVAESVERLRDSAAAAGVRDREQAAAAIDEAARLLARAGEALPESDRDNRPSAVLAALTSWLETAIDRQQQILAWTITRAADDSGERPFATARAQRQLAEEVIGLLDRLGEEYPVVLAALREAAREMRASASSLEQYRWEGAVESQRRSLDWLQTIRAAIAAAESGDGEPPEPGEGPANTGPNASSPGRPSEIQLQTADVLLLRLQQDSLRQRTLELLQRVQAAGWTESLEAERREIASQQSLLADMLNGLLEEQGGSGSDREPERDLPDFDLPGLGEGASSTGPEPLGRSWTAAAEHSASARSPTPQAPIQPPVPAGEDLGEQPSADEVEGDVLRRVERSMATAASLLRDTDSLREPLRIQENVIGDLERLLEQRRDQQQSVPRPAPGDPPTATDDSDNGEQPGPGEDPTEPVIPVAPGIPEALSPFWAQLPAQVQEQIQVMPAIEFLPGYAEAIADFYRRLADHPDGMP